MSKKIVIIGASGAGRSIHEVITITNWLHVQNAQVTYEVLGYLDDDYDRVKIEDRDKLINGLPVIGNVLSGRDMDEDVSFTLAGFANDKDVDRARRTYMSLGFNHDRYETFIHPNAYISEHVQIGHGTVICQGAVVMPNAVIGNHVFVLANAVIEHDAVIGDFANITTGACIQGYVHIGECAFIGANSCIKGRISIGDKAVVGMGAVVTRDVLDEMVVAGNPARPLLSTGLPKKRS